MVEKMQMESFDVKLVDDISNLKILLLNTRNVIYAFYLTLSHITSDLVLKIWQVVRLLEKRGCAATHRWWDVVVTEDQSWSSMTHHGSVVLGNRISPQRLVLSPGWKTNSRRHTDVPPYRRSTTLEKIAGWTTWKSNISTSARRI